MVKKKIALSVLYSFSLLTMMLGGCSNESSAGEKNNKQASSNAQKNTKSAEAKLHFWTYYPEQTKIDGYYMNFLKKKLNFDADFYVASPDTAKEKLNLEISSGDIPDWWKNLNFQDYDRMVTQNVVAEIKPEDLKKYAPKYWAFITKILGDDPFKYLRRNGKIYGLPDILDWAPTGKVVGLREDWLKQVGITKTPETIEEMEDTLTKFRNNDPDGNGKKDTYGLTGTTSELESLFTFVFGAYGVYPGTFTEDNGKIVRGEILPGAKEALKVLNRWYQNELIDPEFIVNKGNNVREKIAQGKAGTAGDYWFMFAQDGVFCCNDTYAALHKQNPNAGLVMTPGPKGPGGKFGMVQYNALIGVDIMFGKQLEEDHDKMIKYLQIFEYANFDMDARIALTYGEEGKTFKKSTDGSYEYIPPYNDNKERQQYGFDGSYSVPGSWNDNFNEELINLATVDKSLIPIRNKLITMGKGKYDILRPIDKPIYNDYKESLDKLTMQTFTDIITGQKPMDDFDKYVSVWKKMGGDKVMAEAQEGYEKLKKQ